MKKYEEEFDEEEFDEETFDDNFDIKLLSDLLDYEYQENVGFNINIKMKLNPCPYFNILVDDENKIKEKEIENSAGYYNINKKNKKF